MSKPKLTIAHLYPDEMNIYGDMGNIIALRKRLEWRGIEHRFLQVGLSQKCDFRKVDIIFSGGGQDAGQEQVAKDLSRRAANLRTAIQEGVSTLTVCGAYQLFGHSFTTSDGRVLPGIGVFDAYTQGTSNRLIGNIVVKSLWGKLVGFENHSGQTYLADNQRSLGRVVKGYGNNLKSKQEGARIFNAIGTYMHGPVLPKNPSLADLLITNALRRKYPAYVLRRLDDHAERDAASQAANRPR